MRDLKDRTALILRGSGGLGRAVARALTGAGVRVILVDADARALAEATAATGATGLRADPSEELHRCVGRRFPPPDILVIAPVAPGHASAPSGMAGTDWSGMFAAGVMCGVQFAEAVLPGMRKAGWGRVVVLVPTGDRPDAATAAMRAACRALFLTLEQGASTPRVRILTLDVASDDPQAAAAAVTAAL